jgi:hypothetical protein
MMGLSYARSTASLTVGNVQASAGCVQAFVPPATLTKAAAIDLPASGGVFFTPADLHVWRNRAAAGPFVQRHDYMHGSPGDWVRITANANKLATSGEPLPAASYTGQWRATHGTIVRDAAFHYLLTLDPTSLGAVRSQLLAQASHAQNDLTKLCIRELDHSIRDAWFDEASWLLRHMVAYDFVRNALPAHERLLIENWIRRNAYLLATQLDVVNGFAFPNRLRGDYTTRGRDAAANTEATIFASQRVDSNGDCKIDSADNPNSLPVYAYVRADGTRGPRISMLSQWFNNRKSINAAAIGIAGLLLNDAELVSRSKRYTMEWLTYAVWPDGSEGENLRNGNYCIPKQGVIYAATNIQAALLVASALARRGDSSLYAFRTTDGLFGTSSATNQPAKSLELVATTHVKLALRELPWYRNESHKTVQQPRESTHLGKLEAYYMGTSDPTDTYHELGMLPAAQYVPGAAIGALVLRDAAVTSLRFPGSTGNPVATGFGSWVSAWTDAFNALPSPFLMR